MLRSTTFFTCYLLRQCCATSSTQQVAQLVAPCKRTLSRFNTKSQCWHTRHSVQGTYTSLVRSLSLVFYGREKQRPVGEGLVLQFFDQAERSAAQHHRTTKAGNSVRRPAGRLCMGRSSWDVVGHRPGIGYVSSRNRGIGRASCVEPMPARRRPAVSNLFDIAGRPTPDRQMFWVVCHKSGTCSNTNRHEFIL